MAGAVPFVELFAIDSRLTFVFFSACSEILVSSPTKDCPQNALHPSVSPHIVPCVEDKSYIPRVLRNVSIKLLEINLTLLFAHGDGIVNRAG